MTLSLTAPSYLDHPIMRHLVLTWPLTSYVAIRSPSSQSIKRGLSQDTTPAVQKSYVSLAYRSLLSLLEVDLRNHETAHLLMAPNRPNLPTITPGDIPIQDIIQRLDAGVEVQIGIEKVVTLVAKDIEAPLVCMRATKYLDTRSTSFVHEVADLRILGADEIGADCVDIVLSNGEVEPGGGAIDTASRGTVIVGQYWDW